MSLNKAWCEIPLRARDGTVRAWAKVDVDDYEQLTNIGRWSFNPARGYAYRRFGKNKNMLLHRVVMDALDRPEEIDHINRDKLDNRRENLRFADHFVNMQNLGKSNVSFQKDIKRWRVQFTRYGKKIHVGCYGTRDEAVAAADAWRTHVSQP